MITAIIFIVVAVLLAAAIIFLIVREVLTSHMNKGNKAEKEEEEVSKLKDDEEHRPAVRVNLLSQTFEILHLLCVFVLLAKKFDVEFERFHIKFCLSWKTF